MYPRRPGTGTTSWPDSSHVPSSACSRARSESGDRRVDGHVRSVEVEHPPWPSTCSSPCRTSRSTGPGPLPNGSGASPAAPARRPHAGPRPGGSRPARKSRPQAGRHGVRATGRSRGGFRGRQDPLKSVGSFDPSRRRSIAGLASRKFPSRGSSHLVEMVGVARTVSSIVVRSPWICRVAEMMFSMSLAIISK